MEDPLSPREFLHRFHLPQLVRINEAHLHQLNATRVSASGANTANRTRSLDSTATTSSTSSSYGKGHCPSEEEKKLSGTLHGMFKKVHGSPPLPPSGNKSIVDGNLLDLDQPFLLYKAYSCRQVIANTLAPDSSGDVCNYKRGGPALLIPENYTGKSLCLGEQLSPLIASARGLAD